MQFIVNTDKKTIKASGLKFVVNIPENQLEFWKTTEDQAKNSVYDSKKAVDYLRYKDGKIEFCYSTCVVKGSETEPPKYEYSPLFVFDLEDYVLKTTNGAKLKPSIVTQNVRHLDTSSDPDQKWLNPFYYYWKGLAYGSTQRTHAKYMFELSSKDIEELRVVEKLLRAGFIVPASSLPNIVNNSRARGKEDWLQQKPWSLVDLTEGVFKMLVSDSDLLYKFRYNSSLDALRKFEHWDEFLPILKSTGYGSKFFDLLLSTNARDDLSNLVGDKSYDRKRLLEYLFQDLPEKQGFGDVAQALSLLRDYAGMSAAVQGHIENKYPKYLKTEHDMIVVKYNSVKQALEDAEVMKIYEEKSFYDYRSENCYDSDEDGTLWYFRIERPSSAQDIVEEGKEMHHCVATYVPRVKQNDGCLILFMRSVNPRSYWNSNKMRRHCTIEVNEKDKLIIQMRGIYNRDPNVLELKCLKEYCDRKELTVSGYLQDLYEKLTHMKWNTSKEERMVEAC